MSQDIFLVLYINIDEKTSIVEFYNWGLAKEGKLEERMSSQMRKSPPQGMDDPGVGRFLVSSSIEISLVVASVGTTLTTVGRDKFWQFWL